MGLAALLGAGCASDKKGSAPALGSIEVRDRTPNQIADAAIEIFRAHDYQVALHTKRNLTFEKPASGFSRLAYGDWTSANSVWERVRLTLVPEGVFQYRIDCNAQLISNKGDPTEEPVKYGHVRRKPLQQVLDELAARLLLPPAEPLPAPKE